MSSVNLLPSRRGETTRPAPLDQFPVSLAEREGAVKGMMHGEGSCSFTPAGQERQERDAVHPRGAFPRFRARDLRDRGEDVGQFDQSVADPAAFHLRGPADEKGHAVTAFEDVRLGAAPVRVAVVAEAGGL